MRHVTADIWGAVVIADSVKEGAKEAIQSMKQVGVKKCVMLTGDRQQAARAVAREIGIDQVHAELLPGDKVTKVEELLKGVDKPVTVAVYRAATRA